MRSLAIVFSLALPCLLACATAKSVIEIPPCADRVEIQGQAQRLSPTRFELDHTFDLMLSKTQLSFQTAGGVKDFVVQSTQPEPVRLFLGLGAGVIGGLLFGSAAYDLSQGQDPLYPSLWGTGLVAVGTAVAVTGWHPPQSYITFSSACPDDAAGVAFER